MHAVHFFLSTLGLNELVTAEDCFSGLIAASIHDIDHPGVNNAFLINTSAAVALRYNDQAVSYPVLLWPTVIVSNANYNDRSLRITMHRKALTLFKMSRAATFYHHLPWTNGRRFEEASYPWSSLRTWQIISSTLPSLKTRLMELVRIFCCLNSLRGNGGLILNVRPRFQGRKRPATGHGYCNKVRRYQ